MAGTLNLALFLSEAVSVLLLYSDDGSVAMLCFG